MYIHIHIYLQKLHQHVPQRHRVPFSAPLLSLAPSTQGSISIGLFW